MILGVYWYFKFPENLYHFKFFSFMQGYGGHTDSLAELETKVQVDDIKNFLNRLEILKAKFPQTYLQLKINGNQVMITIGDDQLFDYYFQLAAEMEELLTDQNAVLLDGHIPFEAQYTKNYDPEREIFRTIEHRFIQMTGSDFRQNNAENFSIRIDCNLPLVYKKNCINDLAAICREENLSVFYYHDFDFNDQCNLMLFFTNGRQYKDQSIDVDVNSFGKKIRDLSQKYPLRFGHFGGMKYYPLNGPHIELMVDEDYIIKKK